MDRIGPDWTRSDQIGPENRNFIKISGLEEDVESNTRREFERFLIAILQCQREEGVDAIDEEGAEADAQELYDVSSTHGIFLPREYLQI